MAKATKKAGGSKGSSKSTPSKTRKMGPSEEVAATTGAVGLGRVPSGTITPYGDPIRAAIARGDLPQMRRLLTSTRAWLASAEKQMDDVRGALADLEKTVQELAR
jgi:hypothetical protein